MVIVLQLLVSQYGLTKSPWPKYFTDQNEDARPEIPWNSLDSLKYIVFHNFMSFRARYGHDLNLLTNMITSQQVTLNHIFVTPQRSSYRTMKFMGFPFSRGIRQSPCRPK